MRNLNHWIAFAFVMGLLFLSSFITIILSLNQGEDPVESDIIVV